MTPFEFKAGRAADAYYRHTQRLNIRLEKRDNSVSKHLHIEQARCSQMNSFLETLDSRRIDLGKGWGVQLEGSLFHTVRGLTISYS
ncbi:hypothetical protein H112_05366 [Trichophyton rubrum D6]|uniref:Uncharacterized protein n=1 Tax=Trichophyton rubrum CBS 288.86 TaxID=1215330 RepID=A0A022VYK8_TRIRU|nr:hypothetical protein H100_05384 [Trichophyton rubrum MR850]EZF40703.1 hypothetical protein H102_05349 [Trichophyton rubrum CBS 100081]EZF51352.1 hypothetical protein H103_05375 [Trichophyton rubrum CBS 288.86]EZF83257.1 hypothetical protein H110_05371 [Trichophyton rubrum MR1448]EZF93966.1 hypothetical protein H113_05411 [Trichophyton rubrum MR1459]EZG15516.1 hypothetical protein H107_05506 [Trichophyton rubrum CBS 202.88]KDB32457.1 hypothetical protein H112_05366 [Trichophyton rubrum D6]